MGNRRRLRQAFFACHPACCFCGGETLATQEDHIPARHLFRGRQWPEGYVFPACATCNAESTVDELAMGWLVRIALSEVSSEDEAEMVVALAKLNDRKPEWVKAMREMSRVDTRRALREQGLSLADLPGEVYMVRCPDELAEVPQRYGVKLAKALYYLHTGRIVPRAGFVKVRALTNAEFMSPKFPLDGFKILSSRPVLTRAGKSLEDQFAYRYGVATDGHAAGFLMQFRESTAIVALVYEDAARRLDTLEQTRAARDEA